jgi:DNA-damage-inducible protein J
VQEALTDQQPAKPHNQVMREARALIDGKRRA